MFYAYDRIRRVVVPQLRLRGEY
ncbi:hypothetical protein ROS42_004757 [Citrobacter freundii]|nr:hypothetical protein [Citrobacter freundii]